MFLGALMTVDRELLWRAYPDGFLAGDGVGTVGGWRCVEVAPFGSVWSGRQVDGYRYAILGGDVTKDPDGMYERRSDWRLGMDTFRAAIDLGDLLPNVDPADTATWACVKQDLANALGWPFDGDLTWRFDFEVAHVANPGTYWSLRGATRKFFFEQALGPYSMDCATAFVMARARLHEDPNAD